MQERIIDIDMKLDPNAYSSEISNLLSNYGDGSITMTSNEFDTRNGKRIIKTTFQHPNNSSEVFSIAFNKDPSSGDIIMVPTAFTNMSNGFYSYPSNPTTDPGGDEDVFSAVVDVFRILALNKKGTFIGIDREGSIATVVEGVELNNAKLCVVAGGKVFGVKDITSVSTLGNISMSFNRSIKDWIMDKKAEDYMFSDALSKCTTMQEQMDILGKYLVRLRTNDEIEPEEFSDIFRQAGILGFTDEKLLSIYKLFV